MRPVGWSRATRYGGICLLGSLCAMLVAAPSVAQDAASLRARFGTLPQELSNNQFQRPLYLESSESPNDLKGEIYATIEQPFSAVGPALQGVGHWCEILILHLNVKDCQASGAGPTDTLSVVIGKKYDQALEDAYRVDFTYKVGAATADYLRVQLNAEAGPVGTKNYRIIFEAVPVDAKRTFVHMSYAYGYGVAARVAMQAYLATVGRSKVGFSVVGQKADGKPVYIGNVRGVVERNTMRYFLAIESYLGALNTPSPERAEQRLRDWYAAIERYPVQLHEMERNEYLDMKRRELKRQQAGAKAATPG